MASEKRLRCAIYTRKSTEHGLELEFNSLDAQRDACEAYIKSQASQGWQCIPPHYDDAAFSGGNLERPALKKLLKDIDAGKIDVVVVYKIDRLTRSLADFAKLVEAFDAKSISFVAVTQQFNTTSSMGRLTLNVLLSFAQFERELSSERVRDKIAASRAKGKWTGGTVPLGYDVNEKKLVPHPIEANTVRSIFRRYLDLKSLQKLIDDLNTKAIVTKRRNTKQAKYRGGISFTYGPLAHLLKNRTYIGETGHNGKWVTGEHKPIVSREIFDQVQALLQSNTVDRTRKRTQSDALLAGKLFDDRGNRMSPSYSTKNGVRYPFYVSSALLRGQRSQVGTVRRVSASLIEAAVMQALRQRLPSGAAQQSERDLVERHLVRIEIHSGRLAISVKPLPNAGASRTAAKEALVIVPWSAKASPSKVAQPEWGDALSPHSEALLQALVRAHAWANALSNGKYESIEALAHDVGLHPKIVRQGIRLAFLSPQITEATLQGQPCPTDLIGRLRTEIPLSWPEQEKALGFDKLSRYAPQPS